MPIFRKSGTYSLESALYDHSSYAPPQKLHKLSLLNQRTWKKHLAEAELIALRRILKRQSAYRSGGILRKQREKWQYKRPDSISRWQQSTDYSTAY